MTVGDLNNITKERLADLLDDAVYALYTEGNLDMFVQTYSAPDGTADEVYPEEQLEEWILEWKPVILRLANEMTRFVRRRINKIVEHRVRAKDE